jgi:hypothetical protein
LLSSHPAFPHDARIGRGVPRGVQEIPKAKEQCEAENAGEPAHSFTISDALADWVIRINPTVRIEGHLYLLQVSVEAKTRGKLQSFLVWVVCCADQRSLASWSTWLCAQRLGRRARRSDLEAGRTTGFFSATFWSTDPSGNF